MKKLKKTFNIESHKAYADSELVFGLVCAVGTDLDPVIKTIKEKLVVFKYDVMVINVSDDILSEYADLPESTNSYDRIKALMDSGNSLRKEYHKGIVAMAVANKIAEYRKNKAGGQAPVKRTAFIVKSLKNKEEANLLREIYRNGFYLFGVYSDKASRTTNLEHKDMRSNEAEQLIERDEDEKEEFGYGQHTRDTFQLSDFFINCENDNKKVKNSIRRILDLIFGNPFITPTFGEYAMFMAFCNSLRSGDLSRQIGAALCKNHEIIATGANDCPKYLGGQYWPFYDNENKQYIDEPEGRDLVRKEDPNKAEFRKIAIEIFDQFKIKHTTDNFDKLKHTQLGDLTEYGRIVHAEMEAIAMCARNNISCKDAYLYTTTFPCHNCAKHIIASGITKVVYIEPYPKSKAFEFYNDSISKDEKLRGKKVIFIPFFGVGPRRFIEMFSMKFGALPEKRRKNSEGKIIDWEEKNANVRDQMIPLTYFEEEAVYSKQYIELKEKLAPRENLV